MTSILMSNSRKTIAQIIIILLSLTLFLWVDNFYALERFNAIGLNTQGHLGIAEYFRRLVYIAEYALAAAVLFSLTNIKRPFGTILLILFWILFCVDAITHQIYGRPADISNIAMLNASVANISDAMAQYKDIIHTALFKTAVLFLPLIIASSLNLNYKLSQKTNTLFFLSSFLCLLFFYVFILVNRGAPVLIGFPKGFSYGFGSLMVKINSELTPIQTIKTVPTPLLANIRGEIENVIVIVDESVEYSRFSQEFKNNQPTIVNFGISYSGGNCSATSNYIIRKGYWERSKNDSLEIKEVDSLFAIAQRQGFYTTYIDNQGVLKDRTIRNYIDEKELTQINSPISNVAAPMFERDKLSLDIIQKILTNGKRNFIFVNKLGAHFPYEQTIAPNSVTANNALNYKKSIQMNCVNYIEKLHKIIGKNSIVFYTSDHGQELNARATHCNTGTNISDKEYTVPFIIMTNNSAIVQLIRKKQNTNALTHLEFSESIRNILGEEIPNANSVFKWKEPSVSYCGMYGQPFAFLGVYPSCHRFSKP